MKNYIALEQSRRIDFKLKMVEFKHLLKSGRYQEAEIAEYEALKNKVLECHYSKAADVQRKLIKRGVKLDIVNP